MFLLGVTGVMGCGKSTVSSLFGELGGVVMDCDRLARQALAPGSAGEAQVVAAFGRGLFAPEGGLDRRRLAEVVFSRSDGAAILEAIVHPMVWRGLAAGLSRLAREKPEAVAILEIPLLFESGHEGLCDRVVAVRCGPGQEERLRSRQGMSPQSRERANARQLPEAEKCRHAHWSIDNSGSLAASRIQVQALWERLRAEAADSQERAWPSAWERYLEDG
ncbi:MAG: dephospho-CoA kinase [Magnetococcales bacterium]|nr:dephospho-CoA kinase [Magnetococcales bacterium]